MNLSRPTKGDAVLSLALTDASAASDELIMGQECYICKDPAYDTCISCKRPTCRHHGKRVGDHFVCKRCADKFR